VEMSVEIIFPAQGLHAKDFNVGAALTAFCMCNYLIFNKL